MTPLYLENRTLFRERIEGLNKLLEDCRVCPSECGAKRKEGEIGNCGASDEICISSYTPHFGEESELVGRFGSGTIFFTHCSLKCQFCQNFDISQLGNGEIVSVEELAEIMMKLQNRGCHNINLVTPTHYSPKIVEALAEAADRGLSVPVVYNTSGYDSLETLKLLDGLIDIYMPDIKYSSNELGRRYSGISNYWSVVQDAVKEMYRQVGNLKLNRSGVAERGVLIRHLVLPGNISNSKGVVDFIANKISRDAYVNIMDQYRPAYRADEFSELSNPVSREEFECIVLYAREKGFSVGF